MQLCNYAAYFQRKCLTYRYFVAKFGKIYMMREKKCFARISLALTVIDLLTDVAP